MPIGICKTNGRGFWSSTPKDVQIKRIELDYIAKNLNFGELLAYFDSSEWDITKLGLIYTDPQWVVDFQVLLQELGFSKDAANDIHYSSHGSQGVDYVSLDVGDIFLREVGSRVCRSVEINRKYQNYFD